MKLITQKATRPLITGSLIASTLLLAACGGTRTSDNDGAPDGTAENQALFRPISGVFPLPSNIFFSGTADGTLNIPSTNPAAQSANELDGWSTVAPILFSTNRPVDPASVQPGANVRMFNVCIDIMTGQPNGQIGPDGELIGTNLGNDGQPVNPAADYLTVVAATDPNQILIKPLRPLRPAVDLIPGSGTPTDCNNNQSPQQAAPTARNGYIAIMTNTVQATDGEPYQATGSYQAAKQENALFDGTSPTPTAIEFGLISPADAALMESIRQLTRGVEGLAFLASGQSFNPADIILSTIFNTQSVGATLGTLAAGGLEPSVISSQNTGLTTADVLPALFGTTNTAPFGFAAIHAGTITVPYYLAPAANANDPAPLQVPWCINTPDDSDGNPTCGATTLFAAAQGAPLRKNGPQMGSVTIPVLITVPTGKAGGAPAPSNGDNVPTVIFQHGITRDRSNLLLVADALGRAGLAGIAIDHPLHGITATDPMTDPTANLRIPGVPERTFDLDLVSNSSGAPGPDGEVDSSGAHYFNLANLLVARDNLRQSVIDIINLSASLANTNNTSISDGNGNTFSLGGQNQQGGSQVTFLGHSLGGIAGSTVLGIAPPSLISSATLAMPGGGIAKLLDGSAAFGPTVTAGLASAGVSEGTPNFETFLSFAQQAVDTVDPINWAAAASLQHNIHLIEVVGNVAEGGSNLSDTVVPNSVPNDPAVPGEVVVEPGPLGGTDPLIAALGLPIFDGAGTTMTSGSGAVQFPAGDHGSILSPAADCPTTLEMQTQAVTFLATDGGSLNIGSSNPAACAAFAPDP